jgi:hypothetical protein
MAEVWRVGYPIDYTATGDKTQEALYKTSQEITKLYRHLNQLVESAESTADIKINNFVDTVVELPSRTSAGVLYAVQDELYVYTGSEWIRLNINVAREAAEDVLGLIRLGTLSGVFGLSPSDANVITEAALGYYDNSKLRGLPPGSIVAYANANGVVPPGYRLCDGTNGTPDLRGRFIRGGSDTAGAVGGSDYVDIEAAGIIEHTHDYTVIADVLKHTHTIGGDSSETEVTHSHEHTDTISLGAPGTHEHELNKSSVATREVLPKYAWRLNGTPYGTILDYIQSIDPPGGDHTHRITGSATADTTFVSHYHEVDGKTNVGTEAFNVDCVAAPSDVVGEVKTVTRIPRHVKIAYLMKI